MRGFIPQIYFLIWGGERRLVPGEMLPWCNAWVKSLGSVWCHITREWQRHMQAQRDRDGMTEGGSMGTQSRHGRIFSNKNDMSNHDMMSSNGHLFSGWGEFYWNESTDCDHPPSLHSKILQKRIWKMFMRRCLDSYFHTYLDAVQTLH